MEVSDANSARSSDINTKTTEEVLNQRTDSFLLIADADEPNEDVTSYSIQEVTYETVTHETATIIESPQVKNSDGNSSVLGIPSSVQTFQVQNSVSDKNPLSVQSQTLPSPSSHMMKRIVENQTILIWQAYDAWRQKFPRPQEDDQDEQINEIRSQKSGVQNHEEGLEFETESRDLEMV